MRPVESAILFLTARCDGAHSEDGAGWNKIDARFGHSFSQQLQEGRRLTYKQRKLVNRIIRKYKRQFHNWEEIKADLIPWVEEAREHERKQQEQRERQEQQLPALKYEGKKFYIKTTYQQREIAKAVPRGRWNPEDKVWEYPDKEEVLIAIAALIKQFQWMNNEAIVKMLEFDKELERRRKAKEEVKSIKESGDLDISHIPLKANLYDHQKKGVQIGITLDHSGLLMEQGTGKTLTAIGVAVYRYLQKQVKRIMVIAPKSVLPEWSRQFEEHTDLPYQAVALDMKGKKKAEILKNWENTEGIQVIAINYESTWRLEKELLKWKPDMIICDESQKIKNPRSKQSKSIAKLGKIAKYRMILTGTPVSQSPLDFYGQYLFLDPTIFGTRFTDFRDRYARMGGYGNYQILGYKNLNELAEKAHSIAYRVTKDEALDLPDRVYQTLYAELEPSARRLYKEMEKESLLKLSDSERVTAPIVLTQIMRLQQINGGFLQSDEEGTIHQVSSAKLNVLKETVEDLIEAGKKLVVFANYIPEINAICDWLGEKKIKHLSLTGKTQDRKAVLHQFQNDPDTKVFVAQLRTGGVGVTLTAADTAIFYSTNYSLIDYDQALARIHRIGQTKKVTYINIVVPGTVDEQIASRLQEKKDVAKMVVDDLKNILLSKEATNMAKKKGLNEKLEALKEDIENSEEVSEEVEANAEEETAAEEEAPKKGKGKKGKGKAKKEKAAPKKEKKEKKEEKEAEEVVTVADLAGELGTSPAVLRKKLRSSDLEKPAGRWEWPLDHEDLDVIRSWSKEEVEAKPEKQKASGE